ncbi:hypothetical protein GCM10022224_012500 [Nonomuraea antimicrobica]|uniref:Universal stress protein family protein n=1 Tax=Nonomuraea antimicrobica TaxID=561173 RepID=A0ABP7B8Q6_9ACTN
MTNLEPVTGRPSLVEPTADERHADGRPANTALADGPLADGPLVLGIDAGTRTLQEAEHLLHIVARALGLPGDAVGCTHFVPAGQAGDEPHVACSLAVPEPITATVSELMAESAPELSWELSWALGDARTGPLAAGAAFAVSEHAERRGGRVVTFPGRDLLTGTLGAGAIRDGSAIDRVLVLASPGPPADDVPVVTNDHVRPVWRDGLMTLLTMPAAEGRLTPAEVPNPTPCCADHA